MIELYPYQETALEKMKNGCILCGGVGSGKSRTALAYYYILNGGNLKSRGYSRMKDPLDLYIITTARKRDTQEWEGEMIPFHLFKEHGIYKHKVVIDSWNNIKKYVEVKGAFFIFDEQRAVGSGKWSRAFIRIAKQNQWIMLSATPGDRWTDYIPVFIANGFYKNRAEFNRLHVIYSRFAKFPKVDKYVNTGRLMKQRNDILVRMDFKRDAIQHHETVYTDYDERLYKIVMKQRWTPWSNAPIVNAGELCQCLRKVVNNDISRTKAVLTILEYHPKAIIFYNYDYELECLRSLGYGPDTIVAEWNGHKHDAIPENKEWVYLVQYTAGAEGWNCVSTDTIIFYSQNYSYRAMVQAAGRIDRLNTPFSDLYYYHLKTKAPIDMAITRALKQKKNFNEKDFFERKR